jgi:hypothetical protein
LSALDERIAAAESRAAAIDDEAARPTGAEREQLETLRRQATRQIDRLRVERSQLEETVSRTPETQSDPKQLRLELRVVEERMVQIRRREVEACRISPSVPIGEALGERTDDPAAALAWDEGADLIHGYRLRRGITEIGGDPLGPTDGDPVRRAERAAAASRLDDLQGHLVLEPPSQAGPVVERTI